MEYLEGTSDDLPAEVARCGWAVGTVVAPTLCPLTRVHPTATPYVLCWPRRRSYWSKMCSQA